jgi:hypothetical protein
MLCVCVCVCVFLHVDDTVRERHLDIVSHPLSVHFAVRSLLLGSSKTPGIHCPSASLSSLTVHRDEGRWLNRHDLLLSHPSRLPGEAQ